MRPHPSLLVKGAQLIAVLTVGTAVYKERTNHMTNDDLKRCIPPTKDIVKNPVPESSSPALFHFPPALRHSSTFSSIRSTTSIRSFLIGRKFAHSLYKQSPESWPEDAFTQETDPPSENQDLRTIDLESLTPRHNADAQPTVNFDKYGKERLEDIERQYEKRTDGDKGDNEANTADKGGLVPISRFAFPVHQLPWQLHLESVALFTDVSSVLAGSAQLREYEDGLREDLGRLFLWGESFGDGRLDSMLAESSDLKNTILELCTTIIQILVEDIVPVVDDVYSLEAERAYRLFDLVCQNDQAREDVFERYTRESRRDQHALAQFQREQTRSTADAIQLLHSSINCLMRLLPTMEKTLVGTEY